MDNTVQLNLARKWRSKNFDQLVGQDLVVKILKNSLYLNQLFPVYLFSGQRGCGKTSAARIFTAALNCDRLVDFQSNPKSFSVPCLECESCKAVATGKHPDFIEIDAASYTGVDNVRQIIETSSLLPVMGKKKIFLIDEAHMLSKAAFNAFLKIMEEPPQSVVFILATTDVEKIIDTVRSRCFQLFFDPIDETKLLMHLVKICKEENIKFDEAGLKLIIKESEGSARDALNLLEQVRFSVSIINKESVLSVLGYTSDENLEKLFLILINKESVQNLLNFLDAINYYKVAPLYIWSRLLEKFRFAVRAKNGIKVEDFNLDLTHVPYANILQALEYFCHSELAFLKSSNKHIFLETVFLRIIAVEYVQVEEVKKKDLIKHIEPEKAVVSQAVNQAVNIEWARFLDKTKSEPLINSIFVQAQFEGVKDSKLKINFDEKNIFFKDLLADTAVTWKKLLAETLGSIELEYNFKPFEKKIEQNSEENIKKMPNTRLPKQLNAKIEEQFDVSDKERWVIANKLLSKFGGTVHEVEK